ncbi:MAG: SDR family NAD(P)-dependent oxidoreductase [Aquabacterium sp.]
MSNRRVCVVTGSSSGIGAATVRRYAREGWDVVVNFSRDPAPAEAVAADCRTLGADALVVQADVAQDDQCRALAGRVEEHFGRCDVLVNNAGTTKFVPMRDLDGLQAEDFLRIYAVNVVGTWQMTRALVPLLRRHPPAAVVNISSVASKHGAGSCIAYSASKGALNTLTISLARTLGPEIRVNAIAPGLVDTPWLKNGLGEQRYAAAVKAFTTRAALAEVIQPEDAADMAYWLGAGAAKTTGEVLMLEAGFLQGRAP